MYKPMMVPTEFGSLGLEFACEINNLFTCNCGIHHLLIRVPLGCWKGKSMHDNCQPYGSNLQSRTHPPPPLNSKHKSNCLCVCFLFN